tara:strand:+ start:79 stop:303 length:225 start_codon:yes stop_codon:yes gene_type:complete
MSRVMSSAMSSVTSSVLNPLMMNPMLMKLMLMNPMMMNLPMIHRTSPQINTAQAQAAVDHPKPMRMLQRLRHLL